eukprot:CAMPEP_0177369146 /NCGR_PEP_ID=MMETSP0368-20130122/41302_1 /TAXON_ID=447022 ORGANISM="Scrippsiella hangoei-like, Strain SHHI-4" /NCGR_SAMPLE_ID=MMETSP0368 /ASSEMBLY_ACC=CAM_ASM_000363 /LENGTH=106 /DNA_ID=CAMNT_0018832323 /DNA_START=14 /DNA_END=332 /DNA_ORIENTATION=-
MLRHQVKLSESQCDGQPRDTGWQKSQTEITDQKGNSKVLDDVPCALFVHLRPRPSKAGGATGLQAVVSQGGHRDRATWAHFYLVYIGVEAALPARHPPEEAQEEKK